MEPYEDEKYVFRVNKTFIINKQLTFQEKEWMLEVENLPNKHKYEYPVFEAFSFLLEYGVAVWKANKQ